MRASATYQHDLPAHLHQQPSATPLEGLTFEMDPQTGLVVEVGLRAAMVERTLRRRPEAEALDEEVTLDFRPILPDELEAQHFELAAQNQH
jgi:hypothetical protein